jgi:transcriptional regulator with XRE-family HTH domain
LVIDRIKSIAKEKGIKISFLCEQVGQGKGYLNDVNSGKCVLPNDRLETIASNLNVSTDYLLGKTDEKNSPSIGAVTEKFKEAVDILSVLPEDEQAEALKYIRYLRSQVSLQKSPEIK